MRKLGVSVCFFIIIAGMFSCTSNGTKTPVRIKPQPAPRDTSIHANNAYIDFFLDSAAVESFLAESNLGSDDSVQMSNFYKNRNYQYAWFDKKGMAEQAVSFSSMYRAYVAAHPKSGLENASLDSVLDLMMEDSSYALAHKKLILPTELKLTAHFFRYVAKAYEGDTSINLQDLGWYIPRKKIQIAAFLDSVVSNRGKNIEQLAPVHPMFGQLQQMLLRYSQIEKQGIWHPISFDKKAYKPGDSSAVIGQLKQRLQLLGDLDTSDSGNRFTAATRKAVIRFQERYGLTPDGVIGKAMLDEINRPIEERVKQILINIERMRWVSKPGNGRYIVVNIPAFTMYVYDSGRLRWRTNVVVGTAANSTVIFNGSLQTIAFSPYWNVPYSIVKKEMGKTEAYFSRRNMEIVGHYNDGTPMVRQKPGGNNSLGRVKFLFPNSYSIYFHDTPAKSLFSQTRRAFSHGCIRVQHPEILASILLDYDPKWTADSIQNAMYLPKEKQVRLKKEVPVFIGYLTAWVDREGRMNFRDDIYGHDKQMAARLFY